MTNSKSIGVFDSGVGGLSVVRYLLESLPHESVHYYADSANAPYGNKSPDLIREYSARISDYLISQGAKLIVVACNTATGIAIHHLRSHFSVPFVGMEPAVKPAAEGSTSHKIGVLATANTFEAQHFMQTRNRFANHVEVFMQVGEGLVELVEKGKADSLEAGQLLQRYLTPMVEAGIDQLVLGCTHYPFLIPQIRRILPPHIAIHDPAPAVVRQVQKVLTERDDLAAGQPVPEYKWESSGDSSVLYRMIDDIIRNTSPNKRDNY